MVYHRVLSATSWLVTIRVWIDGGDNYVYHIISVEDITKSYEISWKENMNGKFPWYCNGHKICQHQSVANQYKFEFFFLEIYIVSQVSVSRYTCVSVPICIITWLCDILALVWHFGPACVTFRPGLCDILALLCVTKASACHHERHINHWRRL